ncbi:hypothetical protein NA56DRAFT_612084 [Hyaloscypha hepaticicola]|uniref:DUF1772-domain-containing protein n=1 Tax=Hyaloscypha hepaticicola TaxID=2082293 RepID=A0A2J6PHG5_9HELO|nr:hypothetical protein NA56DRAFT_612084 [Hyaloscypha hepaticicola]
MATTLLSLLHALQASFSAYTLYLSSTAIQNLQKYEETSKKAAKYSNTAEHQLHKTRTTQASGALSVLLSCLCSAFLAIYPLFSGRVGTIKGLLVVGTNVAVLEMARQHVSAFWKDKAKMPLPGVGEYNDAITKTQEVKLNMAYLIASWAGVGVLSLVL